jgi:N-acetylglutamate synthase
MYFGDLLFHGNGEPSMLERRIEEASLNNWPALQQMLFDGWIMRFSAGYTKRANSVTPIYTSFLPAQEKIVACENFYQKKQLPTIFRLLSFSPAAHELDSILEQREYQRVDKVLILSTEITPAPTIQDPALRAVPLTGWLPLFCQFRQTSLEQHQIHCEMLKRIVPNPLFAVHYNDGLPVACGLGVQENDIFGMFDIVTDPEQRNKGYGTQLVAAMLDHARQNGARRAYLQVVNTNQAALHLYAKFGFHELYHYWYRIRAC